MSTGRGPARWLEEAPRGSEQWEAWEALAKRLGVVDGRGRGGVSAAMAKVIGVGVERLVAVVVEGRCHSTSGVE